MGKLVAAAARNDRRAILVALRDTLSAAIESTGSGRDVAALSKRLMEVIAEIDSLPDDAGAGASAVQRNRARAGRRKASDG